MTVAKRARALRPDTRGSYEGVPGADVLAAALKQIERARGRWIDLSPASEADLAAVSALRAWSPGYLAFLRCFGGAETLETSFPFFGEVWFLPARIVLREHAARSVVPETAITIASSCDPPDTCLGGRHAIDSDGAVKLWHPRQGLVRIEHASFDAMLESLLRPLAAGTARYDVTYGFSF